MDWGLGYATASLCCDWGTELGTELPLFLFSDVPKLDPLPGPADEDGDDEEDKDVKEDKPKKERKTSGPKATNPYANDESSMLFPIFVAIGVFLPTLFCLCKLWKALVSSLQYTLYM